jgi:hypothetical protein
MPASPARIEANRLNAQKSTGPKTDAGKERSRRNAVRHGLTGSGSVLPDAIASRTHAFELALRAEYAVGEGDEVGRFLASQAALAMARLDASPSVEWGHRAEQIERAGQSWDLDLAFEAAELGERLPRRPSVGSLRLLQTAQGCEWLIDRWAGLLASIEADGAIDDARRRFLADLLGIPPEFRDADPRISADRTADELITLAREELELLHTLKAEVLDPRDARMRSRTEAGLAFDDSPAARRLRSYEASCHRRLLWATDQLRRRRPSQPVPAEAPSDRSGIPSRVRCGDRATEQDRELVRTDPTRDIIEGHSVSPDMPRSASPPAAIAPTSARPGHLAPASEANRPAGASLSDLPASGGPADPSMPRANPRPGSPSPLATAPTPPTVIRRNPNETNSLRPGHSANSEQRPNRRARRAAAALARRSA